MQINEIETMIIISPIRNINGSFPIYSQSPEDIVCNLAAKLLITKSLIVPKYTDEMWCIQNASTTRRKPMAHTLPGSPVSARGS